LFDENNLGNRLAQPTHLDLIENVVVSEVTFFFRGGESGDRFRVFDEAWCHV